MASISLPVLRRFDANFSQPLRRLGLATLQINLGRRCNLACEHCHVESGPDRNGLLENMPRSIAEVIVEWALDQDVITTVDFTGGSPEMNPNYRWMVQTFHKAGWHVMTRCNPTIIGYTGRRTPEDYSWIPEFYARHYVEVIASLPCYLDENIDRQRGPGASEASVSGLLKLNAVGYGCTPDLRLNLVHNPVGPTLPPPREKLEAEYRRELKRRHGIVFNELWTSVNMPITRWREALQRNGQLDDYMTRLVEAFDPATLPGLMCRHQINVGPDGRIYDCDFNQAIGLNAPGMADRKLWETTVDELLDRPIATADHCYGCTTGTDCSRARIVEPA